jgi:aspartate kinase
MQANDSAIKCQTSVTREITGALATGINIAMINTSEVCASGVVEATRGQKALECLRPAFVL